MEHKHIQTTSNNDEKKNNKKNIETGQRYMYAYKIPKTKIEWK